MSSGPFDFAAATVRFGDGEPIPVTNFHLDMADPHADTSPVPLFGGSLSNFGFGFKAGLTPEQVEHWRALSAHWSVDPAADDPFADWRCPGCGAGWDEVPAGHSWSRDAAGAWSCRGPVRPAAD